MQSVTCKCSYVTASRIMKPFLSTSNSRSATPSTVSLTHERREVEMNSSQITTSAIALIFNLNPDMVWLQETIGSRIHIPNEDGSFALDASAIAYGLRVNGVSATAPQSQQQQQMQTSPIVSSTTVNDSCNCQSWKTLFRSVTSRKTGTRVVIVRALLSYASNGWPNF